MCPKYTNNPALWSLPIWQIWMHKFLNAQYDLLYILTPSPTPEQDPETTLAQS